MNAFPEHRLHSNVSFLSFPFHNSADCLPDDVKMDRPIHKLVGPFFLYMIYIWW
jgi:hypothetical protein